MGGSPLEFNRKTMTRAGIIGAVLGTFGIILFVGIWIVLTNLDVDVFIRLIVSMCIPPAVISSILGIYMLITHPHTKIKPPEQSEE